MIGSAFQPVELSAPERDLRQRVRTKLDEWLPAGSYEPGLGMHAPVDQAFSKRLAGEGWLGMALPAAYGGGGRGAVDRFLVVEELLRRGAPVGYHWTADRQSGPLIAAVGTEEQKRRFLPAICAAEVSFCIGMSEPDAGSDLASVRTRAVRDGDGWRLSGAKTWTSGADTADWMLALCRTSTDDDRHRGLSQFLVDLRAPGVTVRPIRYLDGSAGFCEVVLDDVVLGPDALLGKEGDGWAQVTTELVYERGGPDRWLSPFVVLDALVAERPELLADAATAASIGAAVAQWAVLRRLSLSVARQIDDGRSPGSQAAMVKLVGTRFEQDVVDVLRAAVVGTPISPDAERLAERLLARAVAEAPSFTIRGGTAEVLKTIVANAMSPA